MATLQEMETWRGHDVHDPEGSKIGTVEELYLDEATGRPEWIGVSTGLFGHKLTLVPAIRAALHDDHVDVPYDKSTVKDAPSVEPDAAIPPEEEQEIIDHYAKVEPELRRGTAAEAPAREGDAVTRSEEELRVGTERAETGRVRLRKHVVTENVETTVPVRREEVRIEREPVEPGERGRRGDAEIGEDEREVVLHEERPVVEKRVEPKERVRLEAETRTDEERVSEDVRKERIEVEGDERRR